MKMSKLKIKLKGVEQVFKLEGSEKELQMEMDKGKNSERQINKLVISKEFEPMFKKSVIKLFSDFNNYTITLECQFCHKQIEDTMAMNYFQLHAKNQKKFITFHFLCALKPDSVLEFQDIMNKFDYRSHINDSKRL